MYWVYNSQGPVARLHHTLQCKTRNVTLGGVEMIAKISRRTLRRQKQDQGQQRTIAGARRSNWKNAWSAVYHKNQIWPTISVTNEFDPKLFHI